MRSSTLFLWCITLLMNTLSAQDQPVALETDHLFKGVRPMELKVKITINKKVLIAQMEDNVASNAFIKRLPLSLPMLDLYGRELVNRFSDPLPTDVLRSDAYKVGDIIYWPPRHSFVILYKQNREMFSRQQIGHIDSDLSFMDGIGNSDVTFEILK